MAATDDTPLIALRIEPVTEPIDELIPPLPTELESDAPGIAGEDDPTGEKLGHVLAKAVDAAIGRFYGPEYQAPPEKVDEVGDAAAPVVRRAMTLFHAPEMADRFIPAPILEVGALGLAAADAWGDAAVLTGQNVFDTMLARFGRAREVTDGSPDRPGSNADGRSDPAGRAGGLSFGPAGLAQSGRHGAEDGARPEPAGDLQTTYDRAAAVAARARGRRPGAR